MLTSDELTGFHSAGVSNYTSASSWISSEQGVPQGQADAERAMLGRDGFRAAAREDLTSNGTAGLSLVEQFRSPAAARDALAFYVSQFKASAGSSGAFTRFKVSGIPGAVGFSLGPAANGINIAFSDGADYYLVGQEGGSATAVANLNAAARHLYHRVHG